MNSSCVLLIFDGIIRAKHICIEFRSYISSATMVFSIRDLFRFPLNSFHISTAILNFIFLVPMIDQKKITILPRRKTNKDLQRENAYEEFEGT